MSRQAIIERALEAINRPPEDKVEEISSFADFIISHYEEQQLTRGVQLLSAASPSFAFLHEEEGLYADLKSALWLNGTDTIVEVKSQVPCLRASAKLRYRTSASPAGVTPGTLPILLK